MTTTDEWKIRWDPDHAVSGILEIPAGATACLVLAHGAGAGMRHAFMTDIAHALHAQRVATLRYQFPAMEAGSKRVDRPATAHAAVRAAVAEAAARLPALPLYAGGKSFGGRMTSQAQAAEPLAGVVGLILIGFPLHPAGQPSVQRADHLVDVRIPMLFLQGTRDSLAELGSISPIVQALGAAMLVVDDADHSFHVRRASGRTDDEALEAMATGIAAWMGAQSPPGIAS